jgi:copper chaperone CopZ
MKKIVTVTDLCCERCARRLADKLRLADGVLNAKGDYKKNRVLVEVISSVTDEELKTLVETEGYEVVFVTERKGLFK